MLFFICKKHVYLFCCCLRVNNESASQTSCIHNSAVSCSVCICVWITRDTCAPPPVICYFKSYFRRLSGGGGVMGSDRAVGGGYQSEARHAPRFEVLLLRGPHVSSAPVSSSRPSPRLPPRPLVPPPAGIPHQTAREPFIPNRMPPLVSAERLCSERGAPSLTRRSESRYPANGLAGGGVKVTGILKKTQREKTPNRKAW